MKRKSRKGKEKQLRRLADSDSDSEDENETNTEIRHHGNCLHFYHSDEIQKFVRKSLTNDIKSFKIFSLDYKCTKCGIIGNPNFVNDLKCHTIGIKYHPKSDDIIEKHLNNNLTKPHTTKNIVDYHPKRLETREHKGKIKSKHTMPYVLSTGGVIATATLNAATATAIQVIAKAGGTLAAAAIGYDQSKPDTSQQNTGPGLQSRDTIDGSTGIGWATGGLAAIIGRKTGIFESALTRMGYKTCGRYPCCGGDVNSDGCFSYWTCCGRSISFGIPILSNYNDQNTATIHPRLIDGCSKIPLRGQRYICCKRGIKSQGCAKKHGCLTIVIIAIVALQRYVVCMK